MKARDILASFCWVTCRMFTSVIKEKRFFLHLDEYPRNKSIFFIVFGQTFPGKFKLAQNHKRNHDYCQRVPKCFKDYRIPEQAGLFANFLQCFNTHKPKKETKATFLIGFHQACLGMPTLFKIARRISSLYCFSILQLIVSEIYSCFYSTFPYGFLSPYLNKDFYGHPVCIYLLKVTNRNSRTRCEKCSKLTLKTLERRQWRLYC